MKHYLFDLRSSIRKSPFLFIFIFIQIVITSVILYISIANCYWTDEQSNNAQIAWGDKDYYKFLTNSGVSSETKNVLYFPMLVNPDSTIAERESEYIKLFRNIDLFYTKAQEINGLDIIINMGNNHINLDNRKEWTESDKSLGFGEYSVFDDNGSQEFNILRTYYVGSKYLDYFNVRLSEGEYFKSEDYLYENDYTPVIMGSTYKKYYSLGEEFTGKNTFGKQEKYRVVGFIAENQYYTPVNTAGSNGGKIYSYDNIILLPYLERSLDEYMDEYKDYMFLYTARTHISYLIIEPTKADEVLLQIENLMNETGLDEIYRTFKCRIEKELASNYKDRLTISIVVCIVTLMFSLFSFIFTMLYKIDGNMKNYAIRMVVGETKTGIVMRYLFESFVVFLLGQITGFCAFRIYAVNSYIYQGYDYLEVPTLKTGIILNAVFYIITAIVLFISIRIKLKTYSVATLIRGNEVRKDKRMPFYRVVIFCMLAIVGIFSMFISSYQVAVDRIDLYYTGYYTKNVKMAYVRNIGGENAPEVKVDLKAIGEEVPSAIINRYVSTFYKGDDFIEERGLYFNGYIDPVNMLWGRFFTTEEVNEESKLKIAVVGKDIYEKYVTFNEDNEPIYHSNDLDTDLKVIGVMGKEDQATNLDLVVFMPTMLAADKFGQQGNYTLDGKDKETVEKLEEIFTGNVSQTATVDIQEYHPRITVEAPTDMLLMLLIMIIINAIVFCFYYVSKQGNIHYVKKLVGYSKKMILTDTFMDFSLITVSAFLIGNAVILILKETLFKTNQLFSIYMIDPTVIAMSLVSVLFLTVFLSIIAITKTYSAGNTNQYRA